MISESQLKQINGLSAAIQAVDKELEAFKPVIDTKFVTYGHHRDPNLHMRTKKEKRCFTPRVEITIEITPAVEQRRWWKNGLKPWQRPPSRQVYLTYEGLDEEIVKLLIRQLENRRAALIDELNQLCPCK